MRRRCRTVLPIDCAKKEAVRIGVKKEHVTGYVVTSEIKQ